MLCAKRVGIVYQNPHLGLLMDHTSSGHVAERLLVAGERRFGELREPIASLDPANTTLVNLHTLDTARLLRLDYRHASGAGVV